MSTLIEDIEDKMRSLCYAIEALPASTRQTKLTTSAAFFSTAIKEYKESADDILERLNGYNPPDRTKNDQKTNSRRYPRRNKRN